LQVLHSSTRFAHLSNASLCLVLKANAAAGRMAERAQSGQSGCLPTLQAGQKVAYQAIELVGRFGARDAALSGELPGNLWLIHRDLNLSGDV
jgi:hypothetical protein